jgi:hypothetical protein
VVERAIPLVLWFLVLANIFDMGGVFGIKYLSYAVAAAALALKLCDSTVSSRRLALLVGMFLVWPLLSLLKGLAAGAAAKEAIGEFTPFLPGLLTYFLISGTATVRPLGILMDGLVLLAVATTFIFALLLVAPDSGPSTLLLEILGQEGHGYFGVRQLGAVVMPNVYFKATLFLVPAFAWFLFRRQFVPACLCVLGLVLAFSRAGLALAAIVLAGFMLVGSVRQRLLTVALVGAAVVFAIYNADLLHLAEYFGRVQDALLGRDDSAQARIGHLDSLLTLLDHDALQLWFGQGAGTAFYSEGAGAWVTDIELDHLDAIRQFGLAWFVLFTALVLYVVRTVSRVKPQGVPAAIALAVAFIASGTNPVLINPLFMILLAMVARLAEHGAPRRLPS